MKNANYTQTLKYITVVNPLKAQGKSRYDYVGQFVTNGTLDLDTCCAKIAAGRPNLDSADVRLVINTLFAVIRDGIAETNCRYSLGDVVFESAISGSLPAMDSSLTAENALYVLITIGDALRQKVAALVPTHDTTDVAKVRITDIMDVATGQTGIVIGTSTVRIVGQNLSATRTGESVTLVNPITEATVSTATVAAEDNGQRLDVNFAAPFATGSYWLVLKSRGYLTPDADPDTCRKKVAATEAVVPPAPTATVSLLYSVGQSEPAEQSTLDPSANIYVKGTNMTKVDGDACTVVITEGGSGGASHTHNLELLEADATHWILKMPTEVASYNMPTLGDFTFTMHGGVAGSAAQTVTKNDISIAF